MKLICNRSLACFRCYYLDVNAIFSFLYIVFHQIYTFTMPQVELKEGPLEQFTHEMEPFLRKQGLPVRLNKGL
jgi:hypothetical protein